MPRSFNFFLLPASKTAELLESALGSRRVMLFLHRSNASIPLACQTSPGKMTHRPTRMKLHPFNRRKFLGSAVCCAAALGASPSGFLIAGEPAGTKRRIRIGFLGATYSHAPGKLAVILGANDFELVGVCEESAAAQQDCEKAGAKIISQEDLLARSEVVAVESAVRDHARH